MAKWIDALFSKIHGTRPTSEPPAKFSAIPTVEFDRSLVTETVKRDLWEAMTELADLSDADRQGLYPVAVESVSRGRDLQLLASAIQARNIDGMTIRRTGDITRFLNSRSTSKIFRERQIALGIEYAQWLYSGAPCAGADGMDRAHKSANGKKYPVRKGLLIGGRRSWPGRELGCKCVAKAIIKGFS